MIGALKYFSVKYWARRYWPKGAEVTGNPGSISGPVIHLRGGNVIHRLESADRAELKNGK